MKASYLPPAKKLRQGNVFTPVCHSVHRGGLPHTHHHHPPGQTPSFGRHLPDRHPPVQCMLGYGQPTAVHILLECNLVMPIVCCLLFFKEKNLFCIATRRQKKVHCLDLVQFM